MININKKILENIDLYITYILTLEYKKSKNLNYNFLN